MKSRVRRLEILGVGMLVLFIVVGFTPAAERVAAWWRVPAASGEADAEAIVALAAGNVMWPDVLSASSLRRATAAIVMQRERRVPLIVFSGGAEETRLRVEFATRLGVPVNMIVSVSGAPNTSAEAAAIGPLLLTRGVKTIILVTDSQHMRRAAAVFAREGLRVLPEVADDIDQRPTSIEGRLILARSLVREYLGFGLYAVRGRL